MQLCIFEQWIAPGTGAPTHWHPVEEVLTVREGEAEMWMDEERIIVSAGQSLIVPAGRKHGFRNSGNVALHIHAVLASPVFEATPGVRLKRCGGGVQSECCWVPISRSLSCSHILLHHVEDVDGRDI